MKPTPFETAGTVLRDNVDAPTTPAHHAMLRARLIDAVERPFRRRGPSRWLLLAPAAAVLVAVLWFGVWGRHGSAVTFRVGPENAAGAVGEYVNPVDRGELTLTFSEGSKVTLGPQARARVAKTTPKGASVVLETGGARVDVVHRPGADWSVAAGPYTVAVKGTCFDVKWDAPSSTLQVVMHNGVVVVRGPGVESGVEVRDTQRFVSRAVAAIDSGDAAAPLPSDSASGARSTEEPAAVGSAAASVGDHQAAPPTAPGSSQASATESWSKLAARGEFRSVLADADSRGIDATLSSASESDLAALAQAARHGGRADLARRALSTIRSRFPGGSQAAASAFLLGRMSDDSGDLSGAIRWYDVYLAEAAGGSLAPEAFGRKMVALRASGQGDAAREAARSYLVRFPSGPYAGIAQELVKP